MTTSEGAMTPGQAAYEAHAAMLVPRPWRWDQLDDKLRAAWEAAAQAAVASSGLAKSPEQVGTIAGTMAVHERDKAAPELAAAMAETRQLRELLAEILAIFGPPAKPGAVRWTAKQVAGWRERAGIEVPK